MKSDSVVRVKVQNHINQKVFPLMHHTYLKGTKALSPVTTKMCPLPTNTAIYPVTCCTTGESKKEEHSSVRRFIFNLNAKKN